MNTMNIEEILAVLPHRYPFLLIDKVLALDPNKSIIAMKNVSYNEPFFMGHFPQSPIMPGVLIVEALAQACGILAHKSNIDSQNEESLFLLAGVDNARFKRVVVPGDQLILKAEMVRVRQEIWKCKAEASVEGQIACTAELLAAKR